MNRVNESFETYSRKSYLKGSLTEACLRRIEAQPWATNHKMEVLEVDWRNRQKGVNSGGAVSSTLQMACSGQGSGWRVSSID